MSTISANAYSDATGQTVEYTNIFVVGWKEAEEICCAVITEYSSRIHVKFITRTSEDVFYENVKP